MGRLRFISKRVDVGETKGSARRDSVLSFESFIAIFSIIKEHAKCRIGLRMEKLVRQRRDLFRKGDMAQYNKIVEKQNLIEE